MHQSWVKFPRGLSGRHPQSGQNNASFFLPLAFSDRETNKYSTVTQKGKESTSLRGKGGWGRGDFRRFWNETCKHKQEVKAQGQKFETGMCGSHPCMVGRPAASVETASPKRVV